MPRRGSAARVAAADGVAPAAGRAPAPQPSLGDFGIVYFGNDWFAENRTSSHHVARQLARRTRVLYVDCPGLRAPKATGRDLKRLSRKLVNSTRLPTQVADGLWHMTLPQIPFRRWRALTWANARLGRTLVQRAIRHLGFERTISWFVVPHPGALAGTFDEDLVVYYCIDDYAALPDVDSACVAQMDAHLLKAADQVFVASARLLAEKQAANRSAVHAPHGVDVALFRTAADRGMPPIERCRTLARPIIGFYGLIEAWIDIDLIAFLARQRPHWTFLLIGRVAVDPAPLAALPNVVLVGPQPYVELPAWARGFDVAIIPYRQNRQVINSNPLKLREYLATGKPVVAVSAPEIDRFKDHVRIAHGYDDFLRQVEDALAHDSPIDQARRIEAVADMSWESRVDRVAQTVEERLAQRAAWS